MTKTFTRTEIRNAISQADASTAKALSVKDKAQRAVSLLTGADFIDAERAVEMAQYGHGSVRCEDLVKRAIARLA